MKLQFSTRARRDLVEIGDFIAKENPLAAIRFIEALMAAASRIAAMPLAYPMHVGNRVRKKPFRSYLIFYSVGEDGIRIITFRHSARLPLHPLELDDESEA